MEEKVYGTLNVSGKVVVITGGASGIGREIARAFHACSAQVVVGDIDEEGLASLEQELGEHCTTLVTDVTVEQQVKSLAEHAVSSFGRIDVGINCAGGAGQAPLLEMDEEVWDKAVALNLKGLFLALKYEAAQMRKQGSGGVIINVTSVTASVAALGLAHYASAKAGGNHLTRIAAEEFRDLGIRVIALAPGLIRTPLAQAICDDSGLRDAYVAHVPSNRPGTVEDVANTALFLASDAAAYINGAVIPVEGGQIANVGMADLAGIAGYYRP